MATIAAIFLSMKLHKAKLVQPICYLISQKTNVPFKVCWCRLGKLNAQISPCDWMLSTGLGIGKDFVMWCHIGSQYNSIMIHCDTMQTAMQQYSTVYWKCKNRAKIQAALDDLGSLNTSHHMILII